jgi:hypothetical protein
MNLQFLQVIIDVCQPGEPAVMQAYLSISEVWRVNEKDIIRD